MRILTPEIFGSEVGESKQVKGNVNGNGLAALDSCRKILNSMLRNIQLGVMEGIYGWTERVRSSEDTLPGMERQ